uniref:FAR1 domain-containing protein n=1 Tax=Lactuca sativa TaxID=4236 RepID=A0A9R1XR29_LACSA|nr:hypothetical protein LSAT_V11C300139330 [Lactuca sativa]
MSRFGRYMYATKKASKGWTKMLQVKMRKKKLCRDVRTGCQAKLRIIRQEDGKWLMDSFNDTHNHNLTMTLMKVMKHRSHINFHRSIEGKSLMVQFGQAGLKPSQIKKQCVDVLSEHRRQHIGKEFYGLIKHFLDKTLVDNSYTKFRDAFAPFTGVNHRVLLEKLKEETFEWLFEHFLKCMFGKYLKVIITDQDKAMCFQRLNIAFVHDILGSMKLVTFDRMFPVTVIFKRHKDNG